MAELTTQTTETTEVRDGRKTDTTDPALFLHPTYYMNFDHPKVQTFAEQATEGAESNIDKAIKLFYAVRDSIRYNPYHTKTEPQFYRASATIAAGDGWCVPKGVLMAAVSRYVGIPARLGYADVRNHLATQRFLNMMGTDIFAYHGYVDLWLGDRWTRVTPVFNIELCEKFGVHAQEFDGVHDAVFQEYDRAGSRHMEYIQDRGAYDDLPLGEIMADFDWRYADFMQAVRDGLIGDFIAEAAAEGKSA